ncbi:MAG: tetratricopeptide repeat protein, partial [Candidatus Sericytochromatia bacterium]
DPEVQETLGYAYLVQKDYAQAIKNFRRVWQLKPLNWKTLANLWIGYSLWAYHTLRNGRFGLHFSLKGGLKLSPGRSRTGQLLDLGQEHFKAGDYAKASMCFRKVRENDPNFEVASIWLANCRLKQGYLGEAVEVCQRGLAKAPASAPLLALLGGLCLAQGKVKNAVRILERALELDPDLPDAWATLGRAHQRERHYREAYDAYQRALELEVEDMYIYRHMGDAALALDERSLAAVAYKLAIEKNPRDLVATQRLIECLYTSKHYDEAIMYSRHALSIDANCYAAHVGLGRVYRSLKSNTAAVEAFEAAIAIRPTLGHLHRQLGAMHEAMTNWYEAIEAYQGALAIDAEDHEAERGLKRAKKMVGKR